MRVDLRQMPLHELARLLRDIANELQSRGNGGARGNSIYNRATGYGGGYGGNYAPGYPSGGYGGNSRYGNEFRHPGQGGNKRRRHHRHHHHVQTDARRPIEPPAPVDDPPAPADPNSAPVPGGGPDTAE